MGVQSGYVVACEFGDMHHLTTTLRRAPRSTCDHPGSFGDAKFEA
jgi:hypothetical protein